MDPKLDVAIREAAANFSDFKASFGEEVMQMDEVSLISHLQSEYVNFYSSPTVNPYVAISAM